MSQKNKFGSCFIQIHSVFLISGPNQVFNHAWDDIQRQKEKGGYPWTHLEHDKEGEVWLDPLSLPKDISM